MDGYFSNIAKATGVTINPTGRELRVSPGAGAEQITKPASTTRSLEPLDLAQETVVETTSPNASVFPNQQVTYSEAVFRSDHSEQAPKAMEQNTVRENRASVAETTAREAETLPTRQPRVRAEAAPAEQTNRTVPTPIHNEISFHEHAKVSKSVQAERQKQPILPKPEGTGRTAEPGNAKPEKENQQRNQAQTIKSAVPKIEEQVQATMRIRTSQQPEAVRTARPLENHFVSDRAGQERVHTVRTSEAAPAESKPKVSLYDVFQWVEGKEPKRMEPAAVPAMPEPVSAHAAPRSAAARQPEVQSLTQDFTLSIGSMQVTVEDPSPVQTGRSEVATQPRRERSEPAFLRWHRNYLRVR